MPRGETVEQWRARMAAKGAHQRRFIEQDLAARVASGRPQKRERTRGDTSAIHKTRAQVPANCIGCGKPMYRKSQGHQEGKVRHCGRGYCDRCYSIEVRDEKPPEQKSVMPTHCIECGWELRKVKEPNRPNTRRYGGFGMCTTCYNRARSKNELPSQRSNR